MPTRTWTLTDLEQDIYVDQATISPILVGGSATGYSVVKRTLRGGRRDGVDAIEVNNGRFQFIVLPTRGMGLWRARLGTLELGWKSPTKGPVHPSLVPLTEPSGLGWLDGFDELLCRCGLESNGAPVFDSHGKLLWPLHGKIANTPAHKVEVTVDGDSGRISITGVVDETRLFFNKLRLTSTITTQVGQPSLTIRDTVTNLSAERGEMQLLYHTNFGLPLVGPGAKVVLPLGKLAPRDAVATRDIGHWDTYDPESPGVPEAVFFCNLAADGQGHTQALLHNAGADQGACLKFNKKQFPCFTVWKNRQAAIDGYVTGLEPSVNYPNPRPFEQEKGRVVVLQPGESRHFELTLEALPDAASVAAAKQAVAAIQAGKQPEILSKPHPEWSRV